MSKRERMKFFFLLVLMIVGALLEMVGIGSIPAFVYLISDPDNFFDLFPFIKSSFSENQSEFFIIASIALIILFLVKNIFIAWLNYLKNKISFNQQVSLGHKLFKTYIYAGWNFHVNKNSAELLRNVNNETQIIINNVLIPFIGILMDSLLIISALLLLLFIEPLISAITIIIFGCAAFLFIFLSSKKLKVFGRKELVERKNRNKTVMQVFGGLKELKLYKKLEFFSSKYLQSAKNTAKAQTFRHFTGFLPKPFLETFAIISIFLISLISLSQGRSLNTMLPVIALFGAAAVKILPAAKQILTNFSLMRFNHVAVSAIYDDMKEAEQHQSIHSENDENNPSLNFTKNITINNLSFRYPDKKNYVFKDLNFELKKGGFYLLEGKSGIGKTTLIEILCGLLKPESGSILIDGKDLFENINQWQKKIGYVPQNVFFFDNSVIKNIAPGEDSSEIKQDNCNEAIRLSALSAFIEQLPLGIHSKIGEKGIKLSGGQRQRIGLARALYHQPELLILDEALSEVDIETENEIIENIRKIKDITIIYVSHKTKSITNSQIIKI